MTDRELLASLKAQIDAHLAPVVEPVDEVITWVRTLGPLSECQPNGFKHQAYTETAVTVTPAAHGGVPYTGPRTRSGINDQAEACVYVPPPAGDILYLIEIGTHDHAFAGPTALEMMKAWVPLSGANVAAGEGGDPPSKLEYETITGWKRHLFATYTEFAAFIAAFVQTEPPPSTEPKPGPTPPEGWAQGQCLPAVHPEVRVYTSFQWHWNKAHLHDLDDINTAHLHCEACIPIPGQPVSGLFRLDVKVLAFHMQGFTFREAQCKSFDAGAKVVSVDTFANGTVIDQHIQEFYVPIVIDMSAATTTKGPSFRLDVLAYRQNEDGLEEHTLIAEVYDTQWFATGRKMFRPKVGEEFTALPYLGVRLFHLNTRNPNDPTPWPTPFRASDQGEWQVGPDGPVPLTFRAAFNPNLHAHPPVYGTIISEGTFSGRNKYLYATKPATAVSGDRVLLRVADLSGQNAHGASAGLIVLKLR